MNDTHRQAASTQECVYAKCKIAQGSTRSLCVEKLISSSQFLDSEDEQNLRCIVLCKNTATKGRLIVQCEVQCADDVLRVMSLGHSNRAVAETKMNERSSRSHSVLTVIVNGMSKLDGSRFHGCLHLIDLAGPDSFPYFVRLAHFSAQ